jgi:histidyl-tRNA synthetase
MEELDLARSWRFCRIRSRSVVRGFDYYTGLVFEVFDTHPENRRSLFGGGRYNNLVGAFGKDTLNAVGFGMGDVTLENFLRTHELLGDLPRNVLILYIARAR